jgi:hypothetical protein
VQRVQATHIQLGKFCRAIGARFWPKMVQTLGAISRKFFTTEDNMTSNEAMVLSIEADVAPNTLRVNLQWQGDHDVSDFDLQRFGKVLRIQDETEHTGWAIIERRFHARIAHTLPGWALHESVCPLKAGDTIPLRRDLE